MHVYQLPVSLYSFKLRLALALKGLEVELREPPGGTYRSPDYRAINRAGTIPALVDGPLLLCETDTIIEYLDDRALGAPLRSPVQEVRARDRMLSRWVDLRLEPAIRRLFAHVARASRIAKDIPGIDMNIAESLSLLDCEFDPVGPYASGAAPGLADCGLTATLTWFHALHAPLGLKSEVGSRIARAHEAMAGNSRIRSAVQDYATLVREWADQRL